jgi:hypothetical protein
MSSLGCFVCSLREEFLKLQVWNDHIRDGFRKQQMTLAVLFIIEVTTAVETIFHRITAITVH